MTVDVVVLVDIVLVVALVGALVVESQIVVGLHVLLPAAAAVVHIHHIP
jgi:hypothetical protein